MLIVLQMEQFAGILMRSRVEVEVEVEAVVDPGISLPETAALARTF